jgi:hypothetical protein
MSGSPEETDFFNSLWSRRFLWGKLATVDGN